MGVCLFHLKQSNLAMSTPIRLFSPRLSTVSAGAQTLGGAGGSLFQQLGLSEDSAEQVAGIRRGFPATVIERLVGVLQLPQHSVLRIARIAPATLTRRRRSPEGRLSPDESDRVYRIAAVFSHAVELFEGDMEAAARWFSEPAKALGGAAPVEQLDTDAGASQVHDLIGRLEYGVYT